MLTITSKEVEITNLNPRKENHGDEMKPALDISVVMMVPDGLEVLRELSPTLAETAWKENGDPNVQGVDFTLDHKVENLKIEFIQEKIQGQKILEEFAEADIKSFSFDPKTKYRLEVAAKIQSVCNPKQIVSLFHALRVPGLGISIQQNQIELDLDDESDDQ